LHPFGIYDEENTPVGFLMYGFNFAHPTQQAFIIRLMVDYQYQGKGYGRFGMERMLEILRADPWIKMVGISYEPANEAARKLYASLGFEENGEIADGEVVALLRLQ
jgi:diamine N-acetyltransferase